MSRRLSPALFGTILVLTSTSCSSPTEPSLQESTPTVMPTPITGMASPFPTPSPEIKPTPRPRNFDAWLSGPRGEITIQSNVGWEAWLFVDWWVAWANADRTGRRLAGTKIVHVPPYGSATARPDCFWGHLYVVEIRDQGWWKWHDYGEGDEGCVWEAAGL